MSLFNSLLYILIIQFCYAQTIYRNSQDDESNIICNKGCNLFCNGLSSCNVDILLGSGMNIIECEGASSCKNAHIMWNIPISTGNISIELKCSGKESCQNLTIDAPPQSNISIICDNPGRSGTNRCNALEVKGDTANLVYLQCNYAYCNNMEIYCPEFSNGINCELDCIKATDCNNNEIFIKENNVDIEDNIGLSYKCSTTENNCNSYINCDFKDGEYQQECLWSKLSINNQYEWKCNNGCHGEETVGFLSGWDSISTVVFVVMMSFGFIVVLFIFIYSMKEKYDEWQSDKEKQRKRTKHDKSKQKTEQRRKSIMGDDDGDNNNKRIYGKGHKTSGSYYIPKKRTQHIQEDSVKKKYKNSTIEEESEYDPNKPEPIDIVEEEEGSYDDDGLIIEDEYDEYANDDSIIEEDLSVSLQSNYSTHSIKSNKSNKSNKPNKSTKANKTQKENKKDIKKGSKKKKKRRDVHADTPIKKKKKTDNDPPPLIIQPFDERKSYDEEESKDTIQINMKRKKKKKASMDKFYKKKKPKKSLSREEKEEKEYQSDDSNVSSKGSKGSKSKSKSKSIVSPRGSKKKKKKKVSDTKTPKKRTVRFKSDTLNKQKKEDIKTKKNQKKKEKTRSKSKPLNKINEDIPKRSNIIKSRSFEYKLKGSNKKKKANNNNDKNKKSKNNKKSKKEKVRKKSAPVNKVNKQQVHRKTNSLISLGGIFKKKKDIENDGEEAPTKKTKLKYKISNSTSSTQQGTNKILSYLKNRNKNDEEEEKEPELKMKKTKSSPLYRNKLRINFSDFMWDSFYASQVYGGALFHAWDIATDFGVIINWIENDEDISLIAFSLAAVILYRALSAIILSRQFGWQWGIIQFLDLTIYIEAYRSLKNKYCQYTRELKWIRRMEAIFESTPQALLQLGFLLKSPNLNKQKIEAFDILIILSFISSLLSIAFSVARDDEAHFALDSMPFLVPYFKSKEKRDKWYKIAAKKKEKEGQKEEKKKRKKGGGGGKREIDKPWIAMYELKSCYEEPESYQQDSYNTIWLPNWKYMTRFTFRFCEATARILTLAMIWMVIGGNGLIVLLISSLLLYLLLQITGIIGYEWGNMWTFVICHPNLTLKTDFAKSEYRKLLLIITCISGWYPLHKIFGFDMVETHFIHRFIETVIELILMTIGIHAFNCCGFFEIDDFGNNYNTKDILFQDLGIGILVTAYICTFITPYLYKFIVCKWIKQGTSLENNLFGIIRLFDTSAVESFLLKSNRSDQLVNSLSPQGYTPLSLAFDIGFYDVIEILLKYGANINQLNKRGENAVFIFAKQHNATLSKKRMYRGLDELLLLNADFSIIDQKGWSPAFHACSNGNVKFIEWLCKNNMSDALEAKDFDNRSIAHIAAVHNQYKFLEQLNKLRKKGKLKTNLLIEQDEENKVPLHYAFEHQSANSVKYLIDTKRDCVKIEDYNGDTPLVYGARYCDVKFFNQLKQLRYTKFRLFLNLVAIEGETDTLKWLLRECQGSSGKLKPLEKYKDETKRNPIHYSCMHGHDKLIILLNKYKFPINDTDYKHRTPAFFAAQRGHLNCLKILKKLNANFKIQNNKRISPLDIAKENNHFKCVTFLQDL